jgi:hypothetical protein
LSLHATDINVGIGKGARVVNGSDMTEPENEDPLSRANELESIVDEFSEGGTPPITPD